MKSVKAQVNTVNYYFPNCLKNLILLFKFHPG